MSTKMKDRMVEGTDLQQQISKYNSENKKSDVVRTPKRHHSDEQRPTTTIDDDRIILSDDGDEDEFKMVTHQRKKFQRGDKYNDYQEKNDVTYITDDLNRQQQQQPQYTQKRKITTTSRTFVNAEMTAMNHHLKKREKTSNERQNDKINDRNQQIDDTHLNNNRNQQQHQTDRSPKLHITNHALHYAVEQHLPPINIKCEPKLNDQRIATMIIKELFFAIEEKFRKINTRYTKPLGFEYWFIDRDGNLQCYTREIELFVFLCDKQNYPDKLRNINIGSNPPKRLPPQRSVILKYVPKDIDIDYIKNEISSKYQSLFNIEEMRGTISGKSRHIRIDLSAHDEYMRILNGGVLAIGGQLIEVFEFLAPPRLLICTKCNTPGHIKKECKNEYDICRRCGENRSQGDHKECIIKCHHCNGEHESTSFQCPLINDFRKELIIKLKSKPNLLPQNVQLFIPTQYRLHGERNIRILTNNTIDTCSGRQKQQKYIPYDSNEWPYLSNNANAPSSLNNNNNIWNEMIKTQRNFDILREKFEKQEFDLNKKYNEQKFKFGSILSLMSVQIQQQNEGLKSTISTLNEIIPVVTSSLEIYQQLALKTSSNSTDQHEKLLYESINQQVQTSISFLNEQNRLISNKHSQLMDNYEKNNQLLQRGVELFISSSE
jgi:hypothetical protein